METDPTITQRPALANIQPIAQSEGQPLASHEDITLLVEAPAVPAVTDLWDKNIGTISSSANAENGVYVVLDWTTLSEGNKNIAYNYGFVDESTVESGRMTIRLPEDVSHSEASVAQDLLKITELFESQELKWAPSYTIDEIKEIYGIGADEKLDPTDVVEFFYAPDGRFHLSPELYQKSLPDS